MGCNCGQKAGTVKYEFTSPNGQKAVYGSEVEAKAAKIRSGGGEVKPVPA